MYCKSCGEPLKDNQSMCLRCCAKAGAGNAFCPNCGKPTDINAEVCLNCGAALKNEQSGSDGKLGGYSKAKMALICFFLGGIGIHNFMMGESKKALFKIATSACFGVGFVFVLMDFIKILNGKYVIDSTKYI